MPNLEINLARWFVFLSILILMTRMIIVTMMQWDSGTVTIAVRLNRCNMCVVYRLDIASYRGAIRIGYLLVFYMSRHQLSVSSISVSVDC